ncbi:hypothetical protein [Paracoccus sp. TOH]|uniref:hypothetical protein n=1 Tax=Paracoccus sp. TOH TaxID=1263728 RepID=UPI0025B161EE|nr:hypothetical protein [Paracoccus sp. TOH]WJS83839.1 hypothetical protein NBE95_08665 [Paracoccus sp. TOH]
MSDTLLLLMLVLVIALVSVIGGIVALLKQQVILDKDGNPIEIELPWFGKIRTNYPSLFAIALGIVLAGFVSAKLDPTVEIRNMSLIATLETDDLPSGSYVMVAAFPQRYLRGSSELFRDGKGSIELSVDEPGPYSVVALSPTEFDGDGRPVYTVTQGPATFDATSSRLLFTGRLTRSGDPGGME